jgi:hypothetical protein
VNSGAHLPCVGGSRDKATLSGGQGGEGSSHGVKGGEARASLKEQ